MSKDKIFIDLYTDNPEDHLKIVEIKCIPIKNQKFIYAITNNTEGKSYVGQTSEFSKTMNDDVRHRFLNHVSEAKNCPNNGCRLLNDSINKYGKDDFTLKLLLTISDTEDADYFETYYIKKYNCLTPDGYNLTTGGQKGSTYSKDSCNKISNSQYGNRREKKDRKDDVDADLPKYVLASKNNNGDYVGYKVCGFPTGTGKRDYISKKFETNDLTKEEKLMVAKQFLNDMIDKYDTSNSKLAKDRANRKESQYKYTDNIHERATYDLPEYVTKLEKEGNLIGFSVSGIKDSKNKKSFQKDFTDKKEMWENLKEACTYKNKLLHDIKDDKFVPTLYPDLKRDEKRNRDLPDNIYRYTVKDETSGFTIQYKAFINDKGEKEPKKKKFVNKSVTLAVNYEKSVEYLREIIKLSDKNIAATNPDLKKRKMKPKADKLIDESSDKSDSDSEEDAISDDPPMKNGKSAAKKKPPKKTNSKTR